MGKNIYKIITIVIVVILFSTVALKKEIDKSIEIVNEKITETMNDASEEEKPKEEVKKKMKMLGAFKVLRYISLLSATNVDFTKEQLLDLNDKLNQIAQ